MKMFCIKDLFDKYSRGVDSYDVRRLTKGKMYEINDSYVNNCTILTFMDDAGTQRTFQIYFEYFITMEEYRNNKLNQIL